MSDVSRYRRRLAALLALSALPAHLLGAEPAPVAQAPRRILVVGDSLSAEYGIARDSGWVSLLRRALAGSTPPVEVVNSSISGDTTAGGLTRFGPLLERIGPDIVIIELGANDGLRGLPVAVTQANLQRMIAQARQRGARVILVGIQVPPNYGKEYAERFRAMFGELAASGPTALVPFLFAGLEDAPAYFQADRMHPNEAAQPIMLRNVMQVLEPELRAEPRQAHPK